jgi:hypothetical protein
MSSQPHNGNRRSLSRVDVYIPIEFRLLPDIEKEHVKSRISGEPLLVDFHFAPPLTHHPQKGWINLLNAKLDVIISKLSLQFEGFHAMPFRYVTLSGSGMGFSSQEAFALCDLLEIKMMLTLNRPVALYLYGEVVKIQRQTSGYFIAVLFKMMDEAIRERIIQFVFEMEREMLRERKEN